MGGSLLCCLLEVHVLAPFKTQFRHLLLAATLENSNGSMVQDLKGQQYPGRAKLKLVRTVAILLRSPNHNYS